MRAFVAVVAGLVIVFIAVMVYQSVVFAVVGGVAADDPAEFQPPIGAPIVILVLDLATGVLGGFVTGRVQRGKAIRNAGILAGIFVLLGIVSLAMFWGREPTWYALIRLVGVPATVMIGGYFAREVTRAHRADEQSAV